MLANLSQIQARTTRWLDRFQPSSSNVLIIAAILVGIGTSLGGILFIRMIEWVQFFLFEKLPDWFSSPGRLWLIIIPAIGGLVAGPIIAFFAREAKGHGVPEVMQAIALNGGRIRPRVAIAKVLASSFCIGSGGSAGREGPIVQVGAALGSSLAQGLNFSETRIRNLVACGAAAGIAATFNAPIAGVVFSIEVILGEIALEGMGSVVISAITASTIARAILQDRPAFTIPLYSVHSMWEIGLYIGLGIIGALVGILFIRTLYYFEDLFDTWRFPAALKPAAGGLLLGTISFLYPQLMSQITASVDELQLGLPISENIPHIFGSGFEAIEFALLGRLTVALMLALVFLKILATSMTLGSGNSGGVFAPALFMGAMSGGVFGKLVQITFPAVVVSPGAYATVGMAAVFAAAARAPLTAILIVFEMTDDYRILLPLMVAVIVSTLLAQNMQKESIYTLKLVRRGINLFRGRDMDVMASVSVEEIMDTHPITVTNDMPLKDAVQLFSETNSHGFPVLDPEGHLWGIISLDDMHRANLEQDQLEKTSVASIATRNLVVAYPDEPLSEALTRMAPRDLSRLPVVDRQEHRKLLGVVRRSNIVRAYEIGAIRRGFALGTLPGAPKGTATGKFHIPENCSVAGKTLAQIEIPENFLVIHIQRQGKTILPHGNTRLLAGDVITVLSRDGDITDLETFWLRLLQEVSEESSELATKGKPKGDQEGQPPHDLPAVDDAQQVKTKYDTKSQSTDTRS